MVALGAWMYRARTRWSAAATLVARLCCNVIGTFSVCIAASSSMFKHRPKRLLLTATQSLTRALTMAC